MKKHALFGGLVEEQMEKILPLMDYEEFEAGRVALAEGSMNDKIYFILEGRVRVSKGGLTIIELGEGASFGEMEVIDIMPVAATVQALCQVRVMAISNRALRIIHKSDPEAFAMIIMNLARDISRRIRRMDDQLAGESPPMEWN